MPASDRFTAVLSYTGMDGRYRQEAHHGNRSEHQRRITHYEERGAHGLTLQTEGERMLYEQGAWLPMPDADCCSQKAYIPDLGWCWIEDGEVVEVIADPEESA